jgi:hypothetical protein
VRYRVGAVMLVERASLSRWLEAPEADRYVLLRHLDALRWSRLDRVRTVDGCDGQIDLDGNRAIYGVGDSWRLCADGVMYGGEPGEWEALDEDDGGLGQAEPQWLLALLAGCVEAEEHEGVELGGVSWRHYRTVCDYSAADSGTERKVLPPFFGDDLDVSRLPVDVWLDREGRICRAVLHEGSARTTLELANFGVPGRVTLPRPEEVVAYEDD